MKYAIFFLLAVVAMAAAAPQLVVPGCYGVGCLTTAGLTTGIVNPYIPRTLVAGPTVVNTLGSRYITPGVIGPFY